MPKVTIKSLESQVAQLRELRVVDARAYDLLKAEIATVKVRLGQVAADNESLIQDKKWMKALIQNLVAPQGPSNALSR